LKLICLKWARITHLDIWKRSYGKKLWPKKRSGVKLAVWLPTAKSRALTRFTCVQVAWNIPLESSWQGATNLLQTSSQSEVYTWNYGPPKSWESQLWQFRDSHLGVLRQNAIWMRASWRGAQYIIRGKVVASLSPGCGESCEFELPVAHPSTKSVPTMH